MPWSSTSTLPSPASAQQPAVPRRSGEDERVAAAARQRVRVERGVLDESDADRRRAEQHHAMCRVCDIQPTPQRVQHRAGGLHRAAGRAAEPLGFG